MSPGPTALEKVAARVGVLRAAEAQAVLAIGHSYLYLEVQRGHIATVGKGKKRRYLAASIAEYMERKGGDARSSKPSRQVDEQKNGRPHQKPAEKEDRNA